MDDKIRTVADVRDMRDDALAAAAIFGGDTFAVENFYKAVFRWIATHSSDDTARDMARIALGEE
jgi:hypothetical protein